jgi:hemerythrin-like domain-containing protein
MESTEILKAEHELVRRLLRCLGILCAETRIVGSLDLRTATELLAVLEAFVDWAHQDKEELHLFPNMLSHASGSEAERLERVFGDHAKERRRLVAMHLHMKGACQGREASVERFSTNALMYLRLQNRHVDEEDAYVLPLAEAMLTPEENALILRAFAQIDARVGSASDVRTQVVDLCRRFGVPPPGVIAPVSTLPGGAVPSECHGVLHPRARPRKPADAARPSYSASRLATIRLEPANE